MTAQRIDFPVLTFLAGNAHVDLAATQEDLESCSYSAFNRGYFRGLEFVDTKGDVFRVINANALGCGISRVLAKLVNAKTRVLLDIECSGTVTLEQFKGRLCEVIENDAEFWSAPTGSHADIQAIVNDGQSFAEVINRLGELYYGKSSLLDGSS